MFTIIDPSALLRVTGGINMEDVPDPDANTKLPPLPGSQELPAQPNVLPDFGRRSRERRMQPAGAYS